MKIKKLYYVFLAFVVLRLFLLGGCGGGGSLAGKLFGDYSESMHVLRSIFNWAIWLFTYLSIGFLLFGIGMLVFRNKSVKLNRKKIIIHSLIFLFLFLVVYVFVTAAEVCVTPAPYGVAF